MAVLGFKFAERGESLRNTSLASGPDILTIATAAFPGAVDNAYIVLYTLLLLLHCRSTLGGMKFVWGGTG